MAEIVFSCQSVSPIIPQCILIGYWNVYVTFLMGVTYKNLIHEVIFLSPVLAFRFLAYLTNSHCSLSPAFIITVLVSTPQCHIAVLILQHRV